MITRVSQYLALCSSVFWILAPVGFFSPLVELRRPEERHDWVEWFAKPSPWRTTQHPWCIFNRARGYFDGSTDRDCKLRWACGFLEGWQPQHDRWRTLSSCTPSLGNLRRILCGSDLQLIDREFRSFDAQVKRGPVTFGYIIWPTCIDIVETAGSNFLS